MKEQLETADVPQDEIEMARQFTPVGRPGSGGFLAREIRLIRAGGKRCADCGNPGTIPTGPPHRLQAVCENCRLNRRAAQQREDREAMRRRTR